MKPPFDPSKELQDTTAQASGALEITSRENCFTGFYRLDRIKLRHRLFSGAMSREITRELFVRPDAVCVLPYDPILDKVIYIEQFRIGAMEKNTNPWQLELVAGLIDKDESPEEVGYREAIEEADLELTALIPITKYYPSVGGSNEFIHLYLGFCDSTKAGGIHGLEEEGEDIRTHVWSLKTAKQHLNNGLIQNAAGIMALQWLLLNKKSVRKQWL